MKNAALVGLSLAAFAGPSTLLFVGAGFIAWAVYKRSGRDVAV